jgi:hypothetical protein
MYVHNGRLPVPQPKATVAAQRDSQEDALSGSSHTRGDDGNAFRWMIFLVYSWRD